MAREYFEDYKPRADARAIIDHANVVIADYQRQGFTLTLRQLYYQFVAADLLPNKQASYDRLGSIVDRARKAGMIDWLAIEDRTRHLRSQVDWQSPQKIINATASSYHLNRWEGQRSRVEVWIEKDALVGVIEPACTALDLPYFACRGYPSQSETWRAGKRIERRFYGEYGAPDDGDDLPGQRTHILHLGDHDPSGIDMTRDIERRLNMFSGGDVCTVERIALNHDQVEAYGPPPNPAKMTDSRADSYVRRYGWSSWELDALSPSVIDALIRDKTERHIDREKWEEIEGREAEERETLEEVAQNWDDVVGFLKTIT